MKSFFKIFSACLLAIVASSFVMFFLLITIISAATLFSNTDNVVVKDGTVLELTLSENIVDDNTKSPLINIDPYTLKINKSTSVLEVIKSINSAAKDDNIVGIELRISPMLGIGTANTTEIRNALLKFKESGKNITASAEVMSHGSYYLSSVADKIFLQPTGSIQWVGLSAQAMFYKGLLDKIGVKPEIIRHGKFKSAVEPFMQSKMSKENREQTLALVGSIWGDMVKDISASRGIDSVTLQQYASNLSIGSADDALKLGLVDSLLYRSQVDRYMADIYDVETVNKITLEKYIKSKGNTSEYSENKVAVIYAEGEITSSSPSQEALTSSRFVKQVAKVQKDSSVKAVVIRINSPGGSALAADVMWHSVKELQSIKPVVVSFGNVAASGGYYIAAPADVILAEPTTITGSIGVFGVLFNAEDGLKENLGITTDMVNTNRYSDIATPFRPMNTTERAYIQQQVDETYTTFVNIVAEGRNLSYEEVDAIAGGRVWSGIDALEIGLIDGFGGLEDAIGVAAEKAGVLSDFRVDITKASETEFEMLLNAMLEGVKVALKPEIAGVMLKEYNQAMRILEGDKVQCIMAQPLVIK